MGFFKHAFHDVKHFGKNVGKTIAADTRSITKPVFRATNTVAGSVYTHAIKPLAYDTKKASQFVVDEAMKFGKKGEQFASAQADVVVNTEKSLATAVQGLGGFATSVETGVGGFLENSWSYVLIGGAVLGALVLSRR